MKKRVLLKLIILYSIASISMFLLLNSFGRVRMEESLIENRKDLLYSEATNIVSESQYYSSQMSLTDMIRQLRLVDDFLDTRIWVVNNNGIIIADTQSNANGVNINDCEAVSRELSDALDREDFIPDAYILEVSSPGLGRTLKKDRHLEKSIGLEVEIKLFKAIDKCKEFAGVLESFDAETITISEDEKPRTFNRSEIALIRLALDF